jgi:hypothetical protein
MNELKTNEVDISNFDLDELCTAKKIDKMFSIDMKSVQGFIAKYKKLKQSLDQPLLDEDAILLLAGVRRKRCGVYFLIHDDEIVYVGQSINIHQRIGEHEKTKIFTTFTYVECSYEELNKIEARYIDMFKPKYNYNYLGRLVMPMSKEQANIHLGN